MLNSATIRGAVCAALGLLFVTAGDVAPVSAQALLPQTWVSGLGSDGNNCTPSRRALPRLFAFALGKTAPEAARSTRSMRETLGPVTITKSITLNGLTDAGFGSIVATSGAAVTIAAGGADKVVLRNLDIQGVGTGTTGIDITSVGTVDIEHVVVANFVGRGISDATSTSSALVMTDSIVKNNGNGIVMIPAGGSINAGIDHVRAFSNTTAGFAMSGSSFSATISNSVATLDGIGFFAQAQGTVADVMLENCVASSNNIGVQSGAGSTVRLSNCAIVENNTGVQNLTGGTLLSYGNNKIGGNTAGNTGVTPASPGQQ